MVQSGRSFRGHGADWGGPEAETRDGTHRGGIFFEIWTITKASERRLKTGLHESSRFSRDSFPMTRLSTLLSFPSKCIIHRIFIRFNDKVSGNEEGQGKEIMAMNRSKMLFNVRGVPHGRMRLRYEKKTFCSK